MKKIGAIATGAVLALAATSAAADNFSGLQLGVQGGYGVHSVDTTLRGPGGQANLNSIGVRGAEGGLFVGFGQMFGSFFVGAEAEGNLSAAEGTYSDTTPTNMKLQEDWSLGLSARAGMEIIDRGLLYGRIGWQHAKFKGSASGPGFSASESERLDGFRLGIGMEYAVQRNLHLRGEFNHTWYESKTVALGGGNSVKFDPDHSLFRIGLSWRM